VAASEIAVLERAHALFAGDPAIPRLAAAFDDPFHSSLTSTNVSGSNPIVCRGPLSYM